MLFVWDRTKAERNLAKHGIAFEEAWEFDWAGAVVLDRSRRTDGEMRFRRSIRPEERVYEEVRPKTPQSRR